MNTYNGYKNYPTWVVALYLENDEYLYDLKLMLLNDMQQVLEKFPAPINKEETINTLKKLYAEWIKTSAPKIHPIYRDLLDYALEFVDWDQIAKIDFDQYIAPYPQQSNIPC